MDDQVRAAPYHFDPWPYIAPYKSAFGNIDDFMKAIEVDARQRLADVGEAAVPMSPKYAAHVATKAVTPLASALHGVMSIWNAAVDIMYYDVTALKPAELSMLSASMLSQGTVLIVPPGIASARIEMLSGEDFIAAQQTGKPLVKALIVPGVGSTAIAAAALARNVADFLNQPVAGVVPGYGAADFLADACGGWFVLGTNNAVLDIAEQVRALGYGKSAQLTKDKAAITPDYMDAARNEWPSPWALLLDESSEVLMLRKLFSRPNSLALLVGHSKGCLSLAFALNAIAQANSNTLPANPHVVTIGCVAYFPEHISTSQYLGSLDVLGYANSRRDLRRSYLPGRTHSLNSLFPTSVRVADVLMKAGARTHAA
ncbi:hypothetical protein [Herbaspirillum sp. ST 5-3]|uniref:hypothetical protein n=1 Tax=Oxalobacteraceae TaxID=75682 RepID=UPI0010A5568C|nr:hypothetical protein [Herbaspirillum sp. ST 5-3]